MIISTVPPVVTSNAENINPKGNAENIPPIGEQLRITEDGQVREYEDGKEEILDP